ncbi:MAG TPA: DNA ligase D [Longimicrobiaceae bacterium]
MAAKSSLSTYRSKRDFSKTAEPRGSKKRRGPADGLEFVIQKHDARQLHYDLRLELDGVMKSWAVPKGPSLDPSVKRLAMEVEDHPIEYNDFEGTIPQGEYGGGTVMLWDRGTYTADEKGPRESDAKAIRRGYHAGKISFTLHGERLRGSFALVRTRGGDENKPQWLLIKHRDEEADGSRDITAEVTTSVATGRTMEEIARGKGGSRVWHSNRGDGATKDGGKSKSRKRASSPGEDAPAPDLSGLLPMLARSGASIPNERDFTFEPKYDGIRVLAFATDVGAALITRNANDKAKQFPEVTEALTDLANDLGMPLVLDGEIVGLQGDEIVRFESLQGRMHVTDSRRIQRLAEEQPAALVVFDVILAGEEVLVDEPWDARRERLEELLEGRTGSILRLGDTSSDRKAMEARAREGRWEGLIAKRRTSKYRPGQRTDDWVKVKLENTQEFVVGGWTEPRRSRQHLGAILLGYYEDGDLIYAGHTGTGFNAQTLREMERRLKPLERKTSPFREEPETNERAHWVSPKVVVQIRFNEWTSRGIVRQGVFVGFRDDKDPREVVREPPARIEEPGEDSKGKKDSGGKKKDSEGKTRKRRRSSNARASRKGNPGPPDRDPSLDGAVVRQIRALQESRRGGTLTLGPHRLDITNPGKVFFPKKKLTKGDLLAYYAEMADLILPWMEDRPLVLKRYPNGIEEEAFYQQAAPEDPPEGVRVELVALNGEKEARPRLVGGNLTTLLYTIQLGAISYDPWHSRVGHLESADYTILDLDPGPGADFQQVVQVARWVKEEMDAFSLHGALKTSGSKGLHIYLPLPPDTPLEAATLVAQIIATRVAHRHPREATVERMVKKRPHGTVYVDYLQNILGKTIAGVYSVRAKPDATVSTPLDWSELTDELDLAEFTLETVPDRVREVGDLWAPAMRRPNSLEPLLAGGD